MAVVPGELSRQSVEVNVFARNRFAVEAESLDCSLDLYRTVGAKRVA